MNSEVISYIAIFISLASVITSLLSLHVCVRNSELSADEREKAKQVAEYWRRQRVRRPDGDA